MSIPYETLKQTVEAYERNGRNQTATASDLGIARSTLQDRLRQATLQGVVGTLSQEPLPTAMALRRTTTLLDANGRPKLQWVRADTISLQETVDAIKEAFEGWDFSKAPILKATGPSTNGITVYPIADLHFGMYAWKEETGDDYDTSIARRVLLEHFTRLVAKSPPSDTAIILNLGDFFHSDNDEQRTRRSGNKLDVDTRFARVLRQGVQLFLDVVALALQHHQYVMIKSIPGNHDPYGTLALTTALDAFYASSDRVIVDIKAAPIWTHLYGTTLIAAAHGDGAKPTELPAVIAGRFPEEWGASKHRYVYVGHTHQRRVFKPDVLERGGAEVEVFRTIAPKDAWGTHAGFVSGRSLVSITHSAERGEVSRQTENLKEE